MATTRHFIGAKTTPEAMFHALSAPEGLEKWWATSASGEVAVGGTVAMDFGGLVTLTFRYDEIRPSERLILTCIGGFKAWQDTVLTHEIAEKDGQVFLTHIHDRIDGDDPEALTYFSTKWTVYLLSLKAYLETGKGTPFPTETKLYDGD